MKKAIIQKTFDIGDIVNFRTAFQFRNSDSAAPENSTLRHSGKAKITNIKKGTKHPYYLIGTAGAGGSNVNGWVDAGTFRK